MLRRIFADGATPAKIETATADPHGGCKITLLKAEIAGSNPARVTHSPDTHASVRAREGGSSRPGDPPLLVIGYERLK